MNPKDINFPKYSDSVKSWQEKKKKMVEEAHETSITRWAADTSLWKFSPQNHGKEITDNNPYVNIVDIGEFDKMSTLYPYPTYPKLMASEESFKRYFGPMHAEVKGDPFHYMESIKKGKEIQNKLASGEIVPQLAKEREEDLLKLKMEIKRYARKLNMPAMGVTKVDRRYISDEKDHLVPYDTLIIFAPEMPLESVRGIPNNIKTLSAFDSYREGGENILKIADFIRSKGYRCLPRMSFDGEIKLPPHAVNAGMGNYSTYGICIIPEVGTRSKLVALLIDAELPLDDPRDWNIEEFCSRCRMCQKSCPGGAIPKEEERFRGALKRQADYHRCLEQMTTSKECMRCVRVCPFSMIGYEKCMDSLPQYYGYNLERDKINKLKLLKMKECE